MSHREPWLEALDRALTLIMERYQEAPTAMIGAVKSDAQLDAEATDSV
jgi:hypothetical protein